MTNENKKTSDELPKNYMCGEEYVNDSSKVEVGFDVFFRTPAEISESKISYKKGEIFLRQEGGCIRMSFIRQVSEQLVKDWVDQKAHSFRWASGYVTDILPVVNQELIRQRHLFGNFLVRTYSLNDIESIGVVDLNNKKGVALPSPFSITNFPSLNEPTSDLPDRSYIKDLIDACNSYFNYNFDDCIRRVITSLDCFIRHHKLPRKKVTNSAFADTVNQHFTSRCEMAGKDVAPELIKVYRLRNEIVHEGKKYPVSRLHEEAKNAIHFLFDAYKFYESEGELFDYVFSLEMQWVAQMDYLGQIVTIDKLETIWRSKR